MDPRIEVVVCLFTDLRGEFISLSIGLLFVFYPDTQSTLIPARVAVRVILRVKFKNALIFVGIVPVLGSFSVFHIGARKASPRLLLPEVFRTRFFSNFSVSYHPVWFSSSFAVVTVERRKSALALWRGTDEFDRFAAALGATLPRIANGPSESNGGDSEGNSEYLEAKEPDSEPEEGLKTPTAQTPPVEKTRPIRINMAGVMRINPFVGRGDGKENPADYIADVEMAAKSWDASYGADTDNPEASKIALFRQNLDKNGDAWHWWSCVLDDDLKGAFGTIKEAFLARYGVAKNKAVSRFNIQNELMLLQQQKGQSIADYVFEAERL